MVISTGVRHRAAIRKEEETDSRGRDDALKKAFLVGQMFSGIWPLLPGCMGDLEEDKFSRILK
jgi:hypothetical protein